MTAPNRSKWFFATRVVLPVFLAIVCSFTFIIIALSDIADEIDSIDSTATHRTVESALQSASRRLREVHGDYAVWDDAALHLYGTIDQAFVTSNYRESTQTGVMFDGAYLLDEANQQVFGFQYGSEALRSVFGEFGQPLARLIASVRGDYRRFDAQVGFMADHVGEVAIVAVGSVVPSTADQPLPSKSRLLVLVHHLNAAMIGRLSHDFTIPGLQMIKPDEAGSNSAGLMLRNPGGDPIGMLIWQARSPGREAFLRIAPTAFLMMALIGLTTLFLLWTAYRSFMDVRRRDRLAIEAANRDSLTGLPNRDALVKALENAVQNGSRKGQRVGIIYLDLDRFKEVNDAFGHATGDILLQQVAAGFNGICRQVGLLARVGGDEFALLLDRDVTVQGALALGDRFVHFFDEPLSVDGHSVSIGASVGIALVDDHAVDAGELLRRADVAMYAAKNLGRNRVALYDLSIDAARAERMRLADDLRGAIEGNALDVVYQPIFDITTMRPTGVEALVRWLHPTDGLIGPDRFIPIAEEDGMIEEIGEWVMRRACQDAMDWPAEVKLSVNVSPVQFRNPRFDTLLGSVLASIGFPAKRLEIEMTETHLVADPERAQAIIESIRALGVAVSLDDFGTGYSSIGYLRRFSFDKLKLDRSLVHGIAHDRSTRSLCEATIGLGRALCLQVTAEGVETEAEATILRAAGCHALQGYAYARPMTAEAVGGFLTMMVTRPVTMPWPM
ncbi:EAL domain-containing protein [Kaistia dalseonensis]|uniref:Diguanylate cyclase (GGDEF)-like protein n=1 Tax=Kaistia dalseonensis TaxID=410840 RepID=A0ABU0H036_9HYPH|nr:EAL domain-containing protein [Kaistia dalseonensis]MCX5493120.1 EAL domain-containing protein [Kaistia dalseonensis]MDQ0435675.1 diguanylate cyclase (GGDEF)-like protein [Kaistia dalseonensis]